MSEESTTPDPVELLRQAIKAFNRGDVDEATSLLAPDAVYVTERLERVEHRAAIRAYFEDWLGSLDDLMVELEEVHDFGSGVVFAAQVMTGRHARGNGEFHLRNAAVHEFLDGLIVRSTTFKDVEEARAAAGRLAREALLDNPVYAALCGAHARLAQVCGRARRYPVDVAPFLGLPSSPSAEDWRDAAELVTPGTYVAVRYSRAELPDAWRAVGAFDLVQMVGERVAGVDCSEAILLGAADVPEMLELVAETDPGPFLSRTIELGNFLGIRSDGALAAMAGERFQLDGWTEISAVCTKPEHRGRGLASQLIGALMAGIQRRSQRAFLHVLSTNTAAIRLYEELGFRVRQSATITIVTREP